MLSERTRERLIEEELYDPEPAGIDELERLGIARDSAFAEFYSHCPEPTIVGARGGEIDEIVWAIHNSGYLESSARTVSAMGLPDTYLPLGPVEGGGGWFYDRSTGGVHEVVEGVPLVAAQRGDKSPDWPDFESFLVWFLAIDA
ncbi:MAG: hypothetical protein ACTH31_14780 [Pseudoclavibacter sp.]